MASRHPRVFSIPPGCPFLPTLVDALAEGRIVDGVSADGDGLADATIYLPTRRAARALIALLADRGGSRARLLPRIIPLGEADESEFELASGEVSENGLTEAAETAPPIAPLERRLILTRLVQRWSAEVDRDLLRLGPGIPFMVPASPADAVGLAADLEALMDAFTTEAVPWADIATAVEADYSKYFEITLKFVQIAAENWPKILAERGASDPARRRKALIEAEAKRLQRDRPEAPIIAAGSTGSVPATAALLAAIAGLPNGAVVLPGLDTDLDEASWSTIGSVLDDEVDPVHGHPQAMLRRLLDRHLRVTRNAVTVLGRPSDQARARTKLISEVLRPADTTDRWAAFGEAERLALSKAGCDGLALVEAADEREEALAAAIALREALATPERTAALVTPDRALATRVAAELARWGIVVDDSAGLPLSDSRAGQLARLAADAAALDFQPTRVLALLAHPDVRLGLDRGAVERAASTLEIGVLRGPAPARGIRGLIDALAVRRAAKSRTIPRPCRRLADGDWDLAFDLLNRLQRAFDGFNADALGEGTLDLVAVTARHRATLEALLEKEEGEEFADEDGSAEAVASLFDDLALSQAGYVEGRFVDYPAFFAMLAKDRTLRRPPRSTHRRVKIFGLLEARLLSADRIVLGGLDESIWPPRTQTDAFLNRPMRARIGLPSPERRIGQTAHDFVQLLGTHDVVMTRALKRDGSPMVPSRFLQRLKAFVGESVWKHIVGAGDRYRHLAHALDKPASVPPLQRPAPRPDPALFPRTLSVTEIETLVRDPYSIFARHILKLDALDPIAGMPSAAQRGTIIHDVLGSFAADYPTTMPPHALDDLIARGQAAFAPIEDAFPELYAEWWPRFERLATAFVVWEEARRPGLHRIYPEVSGSLPITLKDGGVFTLRARADRIEERKDGTFAIIDFKTGQPPGVKEVFAGFSPQLTLEAVMLMEGAFKNVPKSTDTPDLVYVHTSGGRNPLNPRPVEPGRGEDRSVAEIVQEHRRRFFGMLARYAAGEAPFLSRPFPKYARKYSEYDHLARVKEWSLTSAGGGEGTDE